MTIPYTYRVTHKPSGAWYYGVRYANNCHPNDLFISYFTSSKVVSKLIDRDGVQAFSSEIRRTFKTKEAAISWEHRVLRKVLKLEQCLNENAFPAISPEARTRGNKTKAIQDSEGNTIFKKAGAKWKTKQDTIDTATGLTFREMRRLKFNNSLDKNGTRYTLKCDIRGDNNPAKRNDVREKISNTLKTRIAAQAIIPWATGKKLDYVSNRMKGNSLVKGLMWFNDGMQDFRLRPNDPKCEGLVEGRLFSAMKGKKYELKICPHCSKSGSGGNMTRYHFDNCKLLYK